MCSRHRGRGKGHPGALWQCSETAGLWKVLPDRRSREASGRLSGGVCVVAHTGMGSRGGCRAAEWGTSGIAVPRQVLGSGCTLVGRV